MKIKNLGKRDARPLSEKIPTEYHCGSTSTNWEHQFREAAHILKDAYYSVCTARKKIMIFLVKIDSVEEGTPQQ